MIKVFLVEDEMIMRRGIKNNIPWERQGFEFVGEASDGELAYPMIMKTKPDILITDIKMPFMDGLELSSLVKKELPGTKIIILSGYDEFNYAKQAIAIGVTEYLLKPISSDKLLEAVGKVRDVILEEREREKIIEEYKKENQENLEREREKLFYGLLDQTISPWEIHEKAKSVGVEFASSCYTVILLKMISAEDQRLYQEKRLLLEEQIEAYLQNMENAYYMKQWIEGWFILLKSETEEEVQAVIDHLKRFMENTIQEGDSVSYFGGIGSTVHRLGDIRQSFNEANNICASRFFTKVNQILKLQEIEIVEKNDSEQDGLKNIDISQIDRELLENFLKIGSIEEASGFLEAYFDKIGIRSYQSLIFRQYLMVDMYFCVIKFLETLGIGVENLMEQFGDVEAIKKMVHSSESVMDYLKKLFTEAMKLRDGQAINKYSGLLQDACSYVEKNFCNNEISLNTVASHIGMSPSYFSTIFRQETGNTFIEYLTELRMNKAKELLCCTNKKTTEIAYDIGYKDSHYFSYIFKKTQKMTPKDYRNGKRG